MTKAATIFRRNRIISLSAQRLTWFFVFLAYVNPGYLDRLSAFGLFTTCVKLAVFSYFLVFFIIYNIIYLSFSAIGWKSCWLHL